MIEQDKTIADFLDNGFWKENAHTLLEGRHSYIFNLFGESDFPSSDNIPIIFEDVWFPPDQVQHKKLTNLKKIVHNEDDMSEDVMNTIEGEISQKVKDVHEIDNLFKQDIKNRLIKNNRQKSDIHLIILVHGFQGSSQDLRYQKDYIGQLYPNCVFMSSTKNEEEIEESIDKMGQNLATEVTSYIRTQFGKNWRSCLSKISFIGFSLGGVIVRSALRFLPEQQPFFYSQVSLSSIHLGTYSSQNTLLNIGLWLLKKQNQFKSVNELLLNDFDSKTGTFRDSFLQRLSLEDQLKHFQHFLFAYSDDDGYTTPESAHLLPNKEIMNNKNFKTCSLEMMNNIMRNVSDKKIFRLTVDFVVKNKRVDKMIGRAAHIQFIDNPYFVKMLAYNYSELFV